MSCGTTKIAAQLPVDRTRIPPGPPPSVAPLPDAEAAFRAAVAHPVGMPPLEKLARPGAKVTIGIQDGRATHYHPQDQDLRILGIPILLDLLQRYGVRPEDIQIKVANALHRMWTRKEMTHILGPRLPYTLGGRLACIDATDPTEFVDLGMGGVEGVSSDVEDAPVVHDRTAKPADPSFLLEDQRASLERICHGQARRSGTHD